MLDARPGSVGRAARAGPNSVDGAVPVPPPRVATPSKRVSAPRGAGIDGSLPGTEVDFRARQQARHGRLKTNTAVRLDSKPKVLVDGDALHR